MKDSQRHFRLFLYEGKYIKVNNERFSTLALKYAAALVSISRRIMKDSQHGDLHTTAAIKYIKANNERFSTPRRHMRAC